MKFRSNCHCNYTIDPQKVIMVREYHNHTLQTKLRHREEEPHNTNRHKTSGIQFKSTPLKDDCLQNQEEHQSLHNKGRLLGQAVILFQCVLIKNGNVS